jgi:ribose 5-phosphate isomerase RpiB
MIYSAMIYSARQLDQLHKAHGKIVLPCGARLTPLARDWTKLKKIAVEYSDVEAPLPKPVDGGEPQEKTSLPLMWWCDGAAGVSKAALMAASREANLVPMTILQDSSRAVSAVRHLAREVRAGHADGGVLIAGNSAAALMYANRCTALRAVLATGHAAMEAAIRELAPNVLVLEEQRQTMQQAKNMILRFARAKRQPSEAILRELKELAS